MTEILFCTGNSEKFDNARLVCERYGITISQQKLDIDEIQSENAEAILKDKLQKAFDLMRVPLVVSDDSWEIPGLNGFPGPYMKSMNHWLSPEDYLRLTLPLEDRSIYLVQRLGYSDGKTTKLCILKTKGILLKQIKGQYGNANHKVVSLEGDNGRSIAEIYDAGLNSSHRHAAGVWREFVDWYQAEGHHSNV